MEQSANSTSVLESREKTNCIGETWPRFECCSDWPSCGRLRWEFDEGRRRRRCDREDRRVCCDPWSCTRTAQQPSCGHVISPTWCCSSPGLVSYTTTAHSYRLHHTVIVVFIICSNTEDNQKKPALTRVQRPTPAMLTRDFDLWPQNKCISWTRCGTFLRQVCLS